MLLCGTAALAVACGQKLTSWGPDAGADSNGDAGEPAVSGAQNGGSSAVGGNQSSKGGKGGKGGAPQAGNGGSSGDVAMGGDVATSGAAGATGGGSSGSANGGATNGGNANAGNGGSGGASEPLVTQDGLELWLRAEQGITLKDKRVSVWKDASPNHRDATQMTSNYQPAFAATGLSGKPGVAFDGVDDQLTLPALDADFSAGLTAFIVVERDESPNSCEGFFEASNGTEIDDVMFGNWRHALHFEVNDAYVNDPMLPLLIGAPQVAVVLKDGDTGETLLRSNSKDAGQGTTGPIQKVTRSKVFLGHSLYADCGPLHGTMGEVLLYSRRVSDQELQQIESYLQKKWGCCGG